MSIAISRFDRLPRLAVGVALLALLLIWTAVLLESREIRERHEAALAIRAEGMARVYGEVVRSYLRELDTAMLMLRDKASHNDMEGFAGVVSLLRRGPLAELTSQIAIIGPDGQLRYSNLGMPAQGLDLSDRPHFLAHLGAVPDRLYIGAPVLGRVSMQWTVQMSRRILDGQGRFAGVLVLSVPPKVLARMGRDVDLGEDHVLTLLKPDLTVVSRYPQVDSYLGIRLPERMRPYLEPPFRAHLRPSTVDGQERMIAYLPLPEHELLAGVSLSPLAIRNVIAAESRYLWYLGGILSFLVLALLWVWLRFRKQAEGAVRLAGEERLRLEKTLSMAGFGGWEYHLEQGRIYWTPSAYVVFGYGPDEAPPALESFLERVPGGDRERVLAAIQRCRDSGQPLEVEHRMLSADGRTEKILFVRGCREEDESGKPILIRGVVLDVTESRQLALSLRETEKRWQWAVAASRDGVWDVNLETRAAWFSPRWKTMLGYEPDEIVDAYDSWVSLAHPDDLPEVERRLQAYQERRTPFFEGELRMRAKDGSWRWMLTRGQAVEWDEAGQPSRIMGTHVDMTERKAAELALEQESRRLAETQSIAQLGSWEWDVASGQLWWSDETFRIFGLQPGEVAPTLAAFTSRIHPEDRARVQEAINDSLRDDIPYQVDHRIMRPDGSLRIVQERGTTERDGEGIPLRMMGSVQDITARKRVDEAMAESEARYRSLVTAMAEGVVVQDIRGQISFCNDAACQLLGLSREQMLGLESRDACWQAIREDGAALPAEAHPAMVALATGQSLDRVVMGVMRPDGKRIWLTVNARPLLVPGDDRPHGVVTTFADITSAKAAQLNSQLAEAVVNSTSQPIVVTDAEGFIVQANPAFCALAGYDLQEIVGRPVGGIMHSGHQNTEFYAHLWQDLRQRGGWEGEVWNRRRTGEVLPQWLAITAIRNQAGAVERYVGIYMDISEHKRREESMWRAANYDPLTDQPNRLLFQDRLQAGLARARRLGTRLGVLFIDLDRFKQINDTYGHRVGDRVLQEVSRRMAECVREDDTLARIAGDEFMVLLQNLKTADQLAQVAGKLLAAATRPIELGEIRLEVSCSIGYTIFPDDDPTGERLVEQADLAMYQVKSQGRNGMARFTPEVEQ